MTYYAYTCPDCGLVVRLEFQSDNPLDIKACVCASVTVETIEIEEE